MLPDGSFKLFALLLQKLLLKLEVGRRDVEQRPAASLPDERVGVSCLRTLFLCGS